MLLDEERKPSWEANGRLVSRDILIVWKPKVHYRVYMSSLLIHTVKIYSLKTQFNIILPSTPSNPNVPPIKYVLLEFCKFTYTVILIFFFHH
jgi:hypothetical protein